MSDIVWGDCSCPICTINAKKQEFANAFEIKGCPCGRFFISKQCFNEILLIGRSEKMNISGFIKETYLKNEACYLFCEKDKINEIKNGKKFSMKMSQN